jgi:hypothetical protein
MTDFIYDVDLSVDNNRIENLIPPIALAGSLLHIGRIIG